MRGRQFFIVDHWFIVIFGFHSGIAMGMAKAKLNSGCGKQPTSNCSQIAPVLPSTLDAKTSLIAGGKLKQRARNTNTKQRKSRR
jgi:hypothetical protein